MRHHKSGRGRAFEIHGYLTYQTQGDYRRVLNEMEAL
jgi:hypothetical protein